MSQPLDVRIILPKSLRLNVVPALIDDLPSGDEAQVNEEICQLVCGWRGWTLIVHDGCSFPVRLHARKMLSTNIRLSLLTRALICSAKSSEDLMDVQLTPLFDDRPSKIEPGPESPPLFQRFFGMLLWMIQLLNRIAERLLRPLLGAPVVTLRTVGALVGDDNEQVVRLHSEVFPLIGVEPGDHIIVSWADRCVMAVALEGGKTTPEEAQTIKRLKRIDLFSESPEPSALDHLSIGVSGKLRSDPRNPKKHGIMRPKTADDICFRTTKSTDNSGVRAYSGRRCCSEYIIHSNCYWLHSCAYFRDAAHPSQKTSSWAILTL